MKRVWQCQGFKMDFPEGKSPCVEWPWEEQAELSMSWDIHIQGGVLTVYNPSCLKTTNECGPCKNCQSLQDNGWLSGIQSHISHGIAETMPYKFLSMSRLIEVLQQKDHQINALKLGHLNSNWKLTSLTNSNLDYKQFMMAMSDCSIPHMNHLVPSTLQKKHGINGIIWLIERAAIGTYKPQYMEQDHLMSIVLYHLGGAWVAEFVHAAIGTPGLTTIRALYYVNPCITCISNNG